MSKDKKITQIKGVFEVKDKDTYNPIWSLNENKLKEIIKNEECLNEIKKDFLDMNDSVRFNAQIVLIEVKNSFSGNESSRYVISLGHFVYAHHFNYFPESESYHRTSINQEFFEDVVEPFHKKLKTKTGDFYFKK